MHRVIGTGAAPDPAPIMQLGLGFWGSKTLLSAVELGVFTELADEPRTPRPSRRLGLHPRGARDFLDALVALGMLERDGDGYRNTPATDLFLDRDKPAYIGGMLEMANARLYRFWGSLTEALRTGQPQNEAKTGGDFFGVALRGPGPPAAVPARDDRPQHGRAHGDCREVPLGRARDVRRHRHRGGRPAGAGRPARTRTSPAAGSICPRSGRSSRSTSPARSGRPPALLSRRLLRRPAARRPTCSSWATSSTTGTSRRSARCSAKAYDALPAGGALIVYDAIIDDERRENAFGLLMSLNMLIETPGGFDYTGADCHAGCAKPASEDLRRAARRPRLDGRRHQVGSRAGSIGAATITRVATMAHTIDWGSAKVHEGQLSVRVKPDPDFAFLTVFDMVLIESVPPSGAAAWGQVRFAGGRIVVTDVQPGSAPALEHFLDGSSARRTSASSRTRPTGTRGRTRAPGCRGEAQRRRGRGGVIRAPRRPTRGGVPAPRLASEAMINGLHAVIFSRDAEGVRAFLQDVLGFASVDAGGGWPIFALPPAELAATER